MTSLLPQDTFPPGLPGPGTVLLAKYRLERVLGAGGMGVVMAAEHLLLGQTVAIKFLLPDAADDPKLVKRFSREARAAATIRSEHVARVFDVATTESGSPFMVMEFLEGKSLAAHLREKEKLPVDEAVGFLVEACDALSQAHVAGIVHRDLKPENLFLTKRPDGSLFIKVLDFGISKSLWRESMALTPIEAQGELGAAVDNRAEALTIPPRPGGGVRAAVESALRRETQLTQAGVQIGTPYYMSPEQIADPSSVDERTDIWALGTILTELLIGVPPFKAPRLETVFGSIVGGLVPRLRELRPDVPESLEKVVLKCLELNPDDRFQDVAQFVTALNPFAPDSVAVNAARVGRVIAGATGNPTDPVLVAAPSLAPRRRWASFAGAAGVLLALTIAAGAYFTVFSETPQRRPRAATSPPKPPKPLQEPAEAASSAPVRATTQEPSADFLPADSTGQVAPIPTGTEPGPDALSTGLPSLAPSASAAVTAGQLTPASDEGAGLPPVSDLSTARSTAPSVQADDTASQNAAQRQPRRESPTARPAQSETSRTAAPKTKSKTNSKNRPRANPRTKPGQPASPNPASNPRKNPLDLGLK